MSRPGFSLPGFLTLFGAFPTLMFAALDPARASAVGPLTRFEDTGGLSFRRVSLGPGR